MEPLPHAWQALVHRQMHHMSMTAALCGSVISYEVLLMKTGQGTGLVSQGVSQ